MTDILSSISTALSLTSRLREISKNIEGTEFKNLLADLSLELADAKLKIADLTSENADLRSKISELTSATGESCPKCNKRIYELISSVPDETFGDLGAVKRVYKCSGCQFSESKVVSP
ncbi:hypothetical protein [Photobacterium toruni]|uniref:hypothetical protein n=1 Tax=Photobacterium toruni TaxID=1935446 RepID=UPI002110BDF9|nr:hypothetical protein [Photobacterium toruni]MEC6814004.1 hypothetical protein [Photobacterium toruni]